MHGMPATPKWHAQPMHSVPLLGSSPCGGSDSPRVSVIRSLRQTDMILQMCMLHFSIQKVPKSVGAIHRLKDGDGSGSGRR